MVLPHPDDPPAASNGYYRQHARLLVDGFRRCTGRDLMASRRRPPTAIEPVPGPTTSAAGCSRAPFAVLSHGEGADPCFTYGNRTALELFEASWATLLAMPSRLSAEPVEQAERARLLARVREPGVHRRLQRRPHLHRGRGFLIRAAVVWTLTNEGGSACGQAATFASWCFLP